MDVLEYWSPSIDWTRFNQRGLADDTWRLFTQIVQLSHAREHWRQAADAAIREPPYRSLYPESAYARRKHRRERDLGIERLRNHMHRAAFLASERVAEMSYLPSVVATGSLDQKLYWKLRGAITNRYEAGNFRAITFQDFDPETDLS